LNELHRNIVAEWLEHALHLNRNASVKPNKRHCEQEFVRPPLAEDQSSERDETSPAVMFLVNSDD
jgi:hypothetical protein